jgi:CheY-like chemotaxis protein
VATRILVADDEDDIRLLMKILLSRAGFEIVEAADGQEAVESATASPPDLVLLDIRMPRMTGLEALDALRQNAATAGIPVLLVSAYAHDRDTRAALESRTVQYLTKPFLPADLIGKVNTLLGLG